MPNHITNHITFKCDNEKMKEIYEKYKTFFPSVIRKTWDDEKIICIDKETKNFNGWYNPDTKLYTVASTREVLIGLPDNIEYEYTEDYNQFPDFNKILPQPDNIILGDLGEAEKKLSKETGRPTWWDWNIPNWGTKWNSYSCEKITENTFKFETAWSCVYKLMSLMSSQLTDIEILYEYADEDTGSNCGSYTFLNGETIDSFIPINQSREAYELAFKLDPERREDYDENYEVVYK